MTDGQHQTTIDWTALAEQLGTLHEQGESGGSDQACRALEIILGPENLRAAVDHYIALRPGYELARSVLWQLHPWSAMERCREIYLTETDIEARRNAVELLRVVADRRVLPWIPEFLNDPDEGVQAWGAGVVDQLLWSQLVDSEDCQNLLTAMAQHGNPHVRERYEFICEYLTARGDRGESAEPWSLTLGGVVNFTDNAHADAAIEQQKAIAALKAWRAALHSVSLTFETAESSAAKTVVEWDWSEDGSIRENTYYDWGPQRPGSRSAWLFTAGCFYLLKYPEGESDYWRPESAAISARNSGAWESVVTPLYGLWRNSSCRWLSDEIGTMAEWLPAAGGHPVALVMSELRLELDPKQGYLPVDAASNPGSVFHNIVQDFETVAPGILFPKRGIFITTTREPLNGATRHETRWEMTSIRINDPRTAANFKPPRPRRKRSSTWNRKAVLLAMVAAALALAGFWLLTRG